MNNIQNQSTHYNYTPPTEEDWKERLKYKFQYGGSTCGICEKRITEEIGLKWISPISEEVHFKCGDEFRILLDIIHGKVCEIFTDNDHRFLVHEEAIRAMMISCNPHSLKGYDKAYPNGLQCVIKDVVFKKIEELAQNLKNYGYLKKEWGKIGSEV